MSKLLRLLVVAIATAGLGALWLYLDSRAPTPAAAEAGPARPSGDLELSRMLGELTPPRSAEPRSSAPGAERSAPEFAASRVPNLERVRGLAGELVSDRWPNGERMFEAQQRLGADGAWHLNGRWTAWHPDGGLEELGRYAEDREDGDWQWWYASGQPMAEGTFDQGLRVGAWIFWHENGEKMAEGAYRSGAREGPWTFWTADGDVHPEYSGSYHAGRRVSAATDER